MVIAQKLSYGVYVLTTTDGSAPKGCVANSAMQITSTPATFAVSVNHNNFTNKCIQKTGKFAISVLATDSDPAIIGTFGFKSSETVDKFKGLSYKTVEGMPVLNDACGYIVCKVIDKMETSTHTVFLGEMIADELYEGREQMTYDYYHKVIKGSAPKTAPTYVEPSQIDRTPTTKKKYICSVCGYVHEGDMEGGFTCPICGVGPELFKEVEVKPAAPATKKKYICSVCGYEHEGDMPDGFTCPICGVGAELFKEVK